MASTSDCGLGGFKYGRKGGGRGDGAGAGERLHDRVSLNIHMEKRKALSVTDFSCPL